MPMRQSDTSELLEWLSGVDKRVVDDQTILSWHEVIGHLDFKDARMALVSARQDETIKNFIEPKDILRHHKIIRARVEREQRVTEATRPIEANPARHDPANGAPKPSNWDAMCAAYDSGDVVAVTREVSVYKAQLADAGHTTDWRAALPLQHRPRVARDLP